LPNTLSSFTADGFTLGDNITYNGAANFVAWCWSAGNTTVTNNEGTIESQVRSNGSFSIVLMVTDYTGNTTFDYISYCWCNSPTQSFGQYTGNGLAQPNAPVIDCGFEPAFVLIKRINGTQSWDIYDNVRSTSNPRNKILFPDTSDAETENSSYDIDFTSTGFTPGDSNSATNGSGNVYIYAAFASAAGGPTGVVGDITGLDMTLSESTGTWEVGQKVTMDAKPAVSTTANLIFNSTGAVSGLTTADVPGQLVSNKDTPTLTFTEPGTGITWDEELPAGTKLQTSITATNTIGTTSATSNSITPSETTTLSIGQTIYNKEEITKSIIQMQTFDERQAIAEGEKAKDKIERAYGKAQDYISKLDL
jgi:hypothetical protein